MSRISLAVFLSAACALLASVAQGAVSLAHAAGSSVVVSEIFAGGGNAGAPFSNDYAVVLNRSSSTVALTGWTLQYASAASTSWQTTPLTGTIRAGGYYLVKLASGGTVGAALPAADATGTSNLAASGGKVALVRDATALGCGATAGSCGAAPLVEDFVGYGAATDFEGADAAPVPSNTTAVVRAGGGCTDTDGNAADFALGDPSPRNAASAAASCGTASAGVNAGASVQIDLQPLLSIAIERTSINFGSVFAGDTPAAVSERVTVVSNNPAGYLLTVRRSAFQPADLPLGIAPSSTGSIVPIPVAPASDFLVGSGSAATPAAGDVWPARIGFSSPLPAVAPGHYAATVTFTVIGR